MRSIDSLENLINNFRATNVPDSALQKYRNQIFQLLEQQRKFIKKDEIWELYQNSGGTSLNAWTADDMTAYIVTLPKNKIELFYWIESDRMRDPVLREFYSERDVVTEERRMRYDNRPINRYWERLNSVFYVAHPYRLPTIGWLSDIQSYTRQKMTNHLKKFYTPDNALLVLIGNVDPKKSVADIRRYFESIPRAAVPKEEVVTREPEPIGQTRFTVHDDAEPRIDMLFHTPGYPHDDLYRLDVVEQILSGRSGRLYRRLVTQEGLCVDAGGENNIRLQDGYFHIWAELKTDSDPAKVEKIMLEEIGKLKSTDPTNKDMERTKNEIKMSFISGLQSLEGLSDRLAFFERLRSWKDLLQYPDKIAQVKATEIPQIATKYLDNSKMSVGFLLPKKEQGESSQKPAVRRGTKKAVTN